MTDERDYGLTIMDVTEPLFGFHIGQAVVRVHGVDACSGQFCCIHHPSDHALNSAPLTWRSDIKIMERTCEHGTGHPDPDDFAHRLKMDQNATAVHGCDGCCGGENK